MSPGPHHAAAARPSQSCTLHEPAAAARHDGTVGIIALVPDRWSDIVMPRHQVLRRLARRFPTVWVEPAENWRAHMSPLGGRFLQMDRWHTPATGLAVLEPGFMHSEVHRPAWLMRATLRARLAVARRRLESMGVQRIILYIWRDAFASALGLVKHDLSCYHLDDEYTFDERDVPVTRCERDLLERVDQVIVHSPALMAKKGGVNPYTVEIPNGVDYAGFSEPAPEPADMATIPRPRVGYAGVIKKQLDLALLVRLAKARPDHSLVMVGPVLNVSGKDQVLAELRALPNVHFLGGKRPQELPAYVQHFDVCLMCYEVNGYTKFIYPLKVNEYLASGRPTVSAAIDAAQCFAPVVDIARDPDEWLTAIDRALTPQANTTEAVARRQAFARQHDWDSLVERMAEWFRDGLERKRT